jgi:DNA-binding transcriptional regulator YiaG
MNSIQRLRDLLTERFPTASIVLDPPDIPTGNWWLDVDLEGHHVVVEFRPGKGYGVSTPTVDDYGVGPDEVYESTTSAFERVKELLLSQTKTRPPVDLALPKLRETMQLSQIELAKRLQINQATLSRIERRSDMLIGTLRSLITAMGGNLELLATFPETTVRIQFDDNADSEAPLHAG